MKASQRVTIIQTVARQMAAYSYPEIEVVLRQFGIEERPVRSTSSYDYVLQQLEAGKDSSLLELHNHFSSNAGKPAKSEGTLWTPKRFRLFLSHTVKDKKLVAEVKQELECYGIDCFVAHEDIEPTAEWHDEIERALATCDALAAFLSSDFASSKWCDQEVGYAVGRRVLIVPLCLGGDMPYGLMGKYQGLLCRDLTREQIAQKTYATLMKQGLTKQKMAQALVGSFEDSGSFDQAQRRFKLLYDIKNWTPELLRQIQLAKENNSQIREAWYLPDKVELLIHENAV